MKSVCMLLQNDYAIDVRVRRKAEALVAAGYVVDVLALRSPNSSAATYSLAGVNVYTLGLGKNRGSLFRYAFEYAAFFLWSAFKLAQLTRKSRYSVIDVNTLPDFLVFAAAPARWMGAKIVLDMHEITPEFYMSKYELDRRSLAVRLLTLIERLSFEYADRVININEPIEDLLVGRGLDRSKSTVIMNAVDEAMFAAAVARQARREDGPVAGKKFVMMYHGTLTRIYGLDIAIEALGIAQSELPDAELWILGGGPERAGLELQASQLGLESKVRFVGSVSPDEIPEWLGRCDVGVLPTRKDVFLDYSFSNKLSEYIIMGKPAIVSRLKAINRYFGENALAFFEPNDAQDLARQMIRMYRNPDRGRRYAELAKMEYEPICWAVMKGRYLSLVGGLTHGST